VPKRGGLQFVITQSSSDVQVLNYIQTNLGFGKVIQQFVLMGRRSIQNNPSGKIQ